MRWEPLLTSCPTRGAASQGRLSPAPPQHVKPECIARMPRGPSGGRGLGEGAASQGRLAVRGKFRRRADGPPSAACETGIRRGNAS